MISEAALDGLQEMFGAPDVRGTRYEIRSVLGEGGLGVVYLAHDAVLDRDVALKVLSEDHPSRVARLEREARVLARLEHSGIVPVHDVGELPDGRTFYTMKRVRGERLDRWAAAGAGLRERLAVFIRICDAVAFAHARGIVHCDLKPQNVMVGPFGEVLVLDWGLAQEKGDGSLFSARGLEHGIATNSAINGSKKGDGSLFGTPPYMPPEQARGEAVDERADVFALGTILIELADASPALVAIAAKARQTDRRERYATVPDLGAEISRFLAGAAVQAHRESPFAIIARFGRRHRLPILLVIAYVVMRALLLWAFRI